MGFWNKGTFGFQLSFGFFMTIALPLLVVGALILLARIDRLNNQADETAHLLAELKAAEIAQTEAELESGVETLVFRYSTIDTYQRALKASQEELDSFDLRRVLRQVLISDPSIFHVRLYSNRYLGIIGQEGSGAGNLSPVTDFTDITATTVSAMYLGRGDEPMLDVVVPIRDSDEPSQILGHIIVTQNQTLAGQGDLPSLYDVFDNQPRIEDMPGAYIGLFSQSGQLIGSSLRSQNAFDDYSSHYVFRSDHNEQITLDRYESTILSEAVVGSYVQVGAPQWVLVIELPQSEVVQSLLSESLPLVAIGFGVILLLNSFWHWNLYRKLALPLRRLAHHVNIFALDDRSTVVTPVDGQAEVALVQNAVAQLTEQVFDMVEQLRGRMESQTRDLTLIHQIAQLSQDIRDERFLIEDALRLLREHLDIVDYGQLFTVDLQANLMHLQFGTGDLGRRLLAQQYRLPLSTDNIVGQVATSGQSLIVGKISQQPPMPQSELLEEMQSEVVVPVRYKDEIVGVLDIHCMDPASFSDKDVSLFETVAAQLGRFMAGMSGDDKLASHLPEQSSWQEYYMQRRLSSLAAQVGGTTRGASGWTPRQKEAIQTGNVVTETTDGKVTFAVPVKLRNEILGAVEWTVEERRFNQSLLQTAVELVDRLALAIDNARLFEQSRRLVARERLVNEISRKLTTQTDVRQILQVAVRELGQALGTPETQISLNISETS